MKFNLKTWLYENRVLAIGLLSSVTTALTQLFQDGNMTTVNWMLMGYTVIMTVFSFLANNLRGKWISAGGIFTTLSAAATTVFYNPNIEWGPFLVQLILSLFGTILAIAVPAAKPVTYEYNKDIVQAKAIPPKEQVK